MPQKLTPKPRENSLKTKIDTPSLERPPEVRGTELDREMERVEKRARALELRKSGLNYTEIAAQMGVTDVTAKKYVLDALMQRRDDKGDDLESVRDMELDRCDAILHAMWPKMQAGDKHAAQVCLQILDRRSAYLGLDAPKRTEFIGAVANLTVDEAKTMTDEQLKARATKLMERVLGTVVTTPEPDKNTPK